MVTLQTQYGGDPGRWLELPMFLLRPYIAHLSTVGARSTLRAAQAAALGSGSMSKADARRLLAELQREAKGPAPVQRMTPDNRDVLLAAAGIAAVREEAHSG